MSICTGLVEAWRIFLCHFLVSSENKKFIKFCWFFLFSFGQFSSFGFCFCSLLECECIAPARCAGLLGAALIVFVLNFWTGLMSAKMMNSLPSPPIDFSTDFFSSLLFLQFPPGCGALAHLEGEAFFVHVE